MDISPKPGMWITQNIISHQGDYNIMHVKSVDQKLVYFDVLIRLHTGSNKDYIFGKWNADFNRAEGVFELPKYVFNKSMFQVMKRPSPPIRRAAIKVLFGDK
jgi:hypothetical protein